MAQIGPERRSAPISRIVRTSRSPSGHLRGSKFSERFTGLGVRLPISGKLTRSHQDAGERSGSVTLHQPARVGMVVTPETMEVKMNDSRESAHPPASAMRSLKGSECGGASSRLRVAREERGATQPSEAETPEAEAAPVQLALFPAPGQPPQLCAPLFHIRCPECRAINDVPSRPTMCYVCRYPLRREDPL